MYFQTPKDMPSDMNNLHSEWYVKATPAYVKTVELLSYLYDKYVDHYNEDMVTGQSDLIALFKNLDKIEEDKIKALSTKIRYFKYKINDEYASRAKEVDNFYEYSEINSLDEFETIVSNINDLIDNKFDPEDTTWFGRKEVSQELFKKIVDRLTQLHTAVYPFTYNGACVNQLLSIFNAFADLKKIEINKSALNSLIGKILEIGYPEELENLEELPDSERDKVREKVETPGRPTAIESEEDFKNFKKTASSIEIDPDGPVKNKTQYWEELSFRLKESHNITIAAGTIRQNYRKFLPKEIKTELN